LVQPVIAQWPVVYLLLTEPFSGFGILISDELKNATMKKTLSIISMALATLCANAQVSKFQEKLITTSGNNCFRSFIYNQDESASAVGWTNSSASHGPADIIYGDISKWGDFSNYTAYYTTGSDYANSITRFAPGAAAVAGSTNISGSYDMLVFLIGSTAFGPKIIGGAGNEEALTICSTNDGGFILAGYTTSFGAGAADGYLVKLTSTGTIAWTSTYGTSGNDYFYDVLPTSDGGYIAVGRKPQCFSGSLEDQMAVKFTSTGTVSWARCIGHPGIHATSPNEWANSVVEVADGFVFSGTCNNLGGFAYRMFLTKLSLTGSFVFMKRYDAGSTVDYGHGLTATDDGGFLLCGTRNTLDVSVVKTDASGNVSWAKSYNVDNSSSYQEYASCVWAIDGGYEFCGQSNTAAFMIRTDLNGNSGCNEASFTSTAVSLTPGFSTLGTSNGSGGTISNITLSTTTAGTYEFAYNCKLCPADAGPNKNNNLNSCCTPSCTPVTIGTPAISGLNYSWSVCGASLSSCVIAQPTASPCVSATYTLTVSAGAGGGCTTNTDVVTVTTNTGTNCCGPKRLANPGDSSATMEYELTIFPNPSNGSFHVTFGDGFVSSMIITDVSGRKVYERFNFADNQLDIDLSAESKGMYILTAVIEGQTLSQKISFE
jgi:hypothetical protein